MTSYVPNNIIQIEAERESLQPIHVDVTHGYVARHLKPLTFPGSRFHGF